MEYKEHPNNKIKHWSEGIAYEIAFWNNVYRWKNTFSGMMGWSNHCQIIKLENFNCNRFLTSCQTEPNVLDIGCGMSYTTGNYIKPENGAQRAVNIHYVDPLAPFFNDILKRYSSRIKKRLGYMLPDIEFGMVEYISSFYPHNTVDLAIIQNALDHSALPIKGLLEAIECLKTGGKLYLNHHPNEAETEHYKGFHQYNINNENGKLIIWNKNERHDINSLISQFADITVSTGIDKHVIAVITKRNTVPCELLNHKEDKQYLCRQMMTEIINGTKINNFIKWKLKYWTYNIIQFFIQSLSWERKMKIKRLIKQTNDNNR